MVKIVVYVLLETVDFAWRVEGRDSCSRRGGISFWSTWTYACGGLGRIRVPVRLGGRGSIVRTFFVHFVVRAVRPIVVVGGVFEGLADAG